MSAQAIVPTQATAAAAQIESHPAFEAAIAQQKTAQAGTPAGHDAGAVEHAARPVFRDQLTHQIDGMLRQVATTDRALAVPTSDAAVAGTPVPGASEPAANDQIITGMAKFLRDSVMTTAVVEDCNKAGSETNQLLRG